MNLDAKSIAKFLMKIFESHPTSPKYYIGEDREVFRHPVFVNASDLKRNEIMFRSTESKYNSEKNYPWDNYFERDLKSLLKRKHVLDLGCFSGGRGIAWFERYELSHLVGIDICQEYIDAANHFSRLKKISAEFHVAKGEFLPFQKETFDAILSFDVFEHVQDLKRTLNEYFRVLQFWS